MNFLNKLWEKYPSLVTPIIFILIVIGMIVFFLSMVYLDYFLSQSWKYPLTPADFPK